MSGRGMSQSNDETYNSKIRLAFPTEVMYDLYGIQNFSIFNRLRKKEMEPMPSAGLKCNDGLDWKGYCGK